MLKSSILSKDITPFNWDCLGCNPTSAGSGTLDGKHWLLKFGRIVKSSSNSYQFPLHFLFSQTSTHVSIVWKKHGKCFLFLLVNRTCFVAISFEPLLTDNFLRLNSIQLYIYMCSCAAPTHFTVFFPQRRHLKFWSQGDPLVEHCPVILENKFKLKMDNSGKQKSSIILRLNNLYSPDAFHACIGKQVSTDFQHCPSSTLFTRNETTKDA